MKKIAIILAIIGLITVLFATTMTVHTTNGTQDFEISEITSITFNSGEIVFQEDFNDWNANNWSGNRWSYNINMGSWQPDVNNGYAHMQIGDYDWSEIRTNQTWTNGKTVSITLIPYLSSGGTHEDDFFMGFSENWISYDTDISAGIRLENGEILAYDELNWNNAVVFGNYTSGVEITLTMTWNSDGSLTLVGGGGSYMISADLLQLSDAYLVIVNKSSTDGFDIDQVIISDN